MRTLNLTPVKNYSPIIANLYVDGYATVEENKAAIQSLFIGITSDLENTDWNFNMDKAPLLIDGFRDYLSKIYHKDMLEYALNEVKTYLLWNMRLWEDWSLCPQVYAERVVSLYSDIINGVFKSGDMNG